MWDLLSELRVLSPLHVVEAADQPRAQTRAHMETVRDQQAMTEDDDSQWRRALQAAKVLLQIT
ncbi:hypothetical protein [Nonomuraea roseola]|uniref:Uncharacterized protein n=1 Tax=Nonomuraea roseola TaxID=46179 RepID=A0ABV5QE54_9ACTN